MKNNTEIQLSVSDLKSVLPGLSKVIGRRITLPVLGCVRVERNDHGEVNIQATDLDDYVSVRVKEAVPGQFGAFLVPYEPLVKAIKTSGSKNNVVLIDGGKKGITLRTFIGQNPVDQTLEAIDIKEWPSMPVVKDTGISLDQGMRQALCQAFECASRDETRYVLNSAFLDVSDPKAHYVVSTNSRSLFSANSFTFGLKASLIVPARKFLSWAGMWEEEACWLSHEPGEHHPKTKNITGGWVQFRTDKWTFITRAIDGQYPNWKQIVPVGSANTVIKLSQAAMDELLQVIPKLPGKDEINSPVTLVVANNHLQIQAQGKADDKATTIPIDGTLITGNGIAVMMNRESLVTALQFGLGEIQIHDSLTPLICQANGKRLIIAPLNPGTATVPETPAPTPTETTEPNDERTDMTKTTTTTGTETSLPESSIKKAVEQIEKIKDALKDVISEFSEVLASLKAVEKEKKVTDKEIESIRATLKTIQNVKI